MILVAASVWKRRRVMRNRKCVLAVAACVVAVTPFVSAYIRVSV